MSTQLIKLDEDQIQETIGALLKFNSSTLVEAAQKAGQVLLNSGDQNPIILQAIEAGTKMQAAYATFQPTLDGIVDNFKRTFDVAEYIRTKANVGEVSSANLTVDAQKIDTSRILR